MSEAAESVRSAVTTSISRVLQHEGRRYSLRLEEVFWDAFRRAAQHRGMRENELIATLASDDANNLASRVRTFCMAEAEKMQTAGTGTDQDTLFHVMDTAPAPALLVSRGEIVLYHNAALAHWLDDQSNFVGDALHQLLSIRASVDWGGIWSELERRAPQSVRVHVVRIAKGRTIAAAAELSLLHFDTPSNAQTDVALIWLRIGQPARITQTKQVEAEARKN